MLCATCGRENPVDARFCLACGKAIPLTCPQCGRILPSGAAFCHGCGIKIGPMASFASPAATSPPSAGLPTVPAAVVPASFGTGRYEVRKFLGEGGKKRVFLAHDTALDRDVAFALLKTEGLDEAARQRVSREARAMGRLGDHPHIMPIYDLGQEGGQPYMVLPLMGGGDAESLIELAPEHRLPLERVLEIAQQVCRGLEFAHGKGIVHRDLKPGNVWLTAEGIAKIGDFGLALPLDRPRLTQEGMMVGTVAYMPPEQALGGEVTPRADLYSLGCMLYEMVAGRPPFLGDDAVAIIGQHINTPPVAPSWHNGQCPRPLETLIIRLLAKDPAERPQSAGDVLAALEAIDMSDVGAQHAVPLQEVHALDSLAGGVFVGRQREMGELKAALEDALSGKGRLVTLMGEPGIGKTRTAQELATYAGLRQCQVLWGRSYEGEGAPPYWPWVQAIRSYVREQDSTRLRSEMGGGAADIAEVVSDVREVLPDLQPPPQLEPEQARFRLFDSITAFLKSASRHQPLVLVLEDLHWADRPSLLLLEFLARELTNSRLLVIGTYRDVEVSRRHPLSQTLGELTRERLFQRILLRGLSQGDVSRFIELAAGITPPRGMVEAVYRQTEGNPLFVTEVVRLLVQEGEMGQTPVGAQHAAPLHHESWSVRIPEGVREVIGREFTVAQLKPLIDDLSEDRLLEVLEEALAARVIEELPRAVGRYQFTHALIQETLVEELTTTRRVRLHARIAEALEALYGEQAEARAAELARHFAEAQTVLGPEKLVRYSFIAGERALASYGWEEALAHFQQGLAAKGVSLTGAEPAQDAEAAALWFGLARAQSATLERRQLGEAVASLTRAFDYYAQVGDAARAVAVAEHPVYIRPGYGTGMTRLLRRALALVPPDSYQAASLLSTYGYALGVEEGHYEGARDAFDQAVAIARREKDLVLEMRTLVSSSQVDQSHCRFQESLEKALRAIELARQADDPRTMVVAYFSAGVSQYWIGDLEGAWRNAEAGLASAEQARERTGLAMMLSVSGEVHTEKGDWQTAGDFFDRGLAVSPFEARLLSHRLHAAYQLGEFSQGEAYLKRLLEVMAMTPHGPSTPYATTALVIPAVGRITGTGDRFDVAEKAAEAVLSSPFAIPIYAMFARTGLALMAVQRADVPSAAKQYATLESTLGAVVSPIFISGDHLLGLLAQTMGHLDKAVEHFEEALAFCRKGEYRPELAWTCCDYADALLQRNNPGDRAKAMSLLDEALRIARELGMRPLMERVLSRREILTA